MPMGPPPMGGPPMPGGGPPMPIPGGGPPMEAPGPIMGGLLIGGPPIPGGGPPMPGGGPDMPPPPPIEGPMESPPERYPGGFGWFLWSMVTAISGSTILQEKFTWLHIFLSVAQKTLTDLMTTCACRSAYASCGFWLSMDLASWGLFMMHCFICFISSNMFSGGREATALEMASGAFSGSTG